MLRLRQTVDVAYNWNCKWITLTQIAESCVSPLVIVDVYERACFQSHPPNARYGFKASLTFFSYFWAFFFPVLSYLTNLLLRSMWPILGWRTYRSTYSWASRNIAEAGRQSQVLPEEPWSSSSASCSLIIACKLDLSVNDDARYLKCSNILFYVPW